jgi:SAM-dependent methyltransferase
MQSCPLCANFAVKRLALPHTTVWECASRRCGLRYAAPQLDERSLQEAYRKFYYPDSPRAGTVAYKPTSVEILHQVFRYAIAEFGDLSGWRLLDYGCGTGALCNAALSYGLQPVGIESDANACGEAGANGRYPVYQRLEDLLASEPGIRFDVITLWEVIEHLRMPWIDLANLRRILKTDGRLLVSTPNARGAKARLLGPRWDNYANPTHFYYFTRESLPFVLQQSGFSRVTVWNAHIDYPHHGALRRTLNRALAAPNLQGELLLLGRP